jgi:HEPN domain-containing protein
MMTKNEHIEYWKQSSEDDWKTVLSLFQSERYVHSLFFGHLALEKICKAIWVKHNEGNIPPKIHNLVKLLLETNQEFQVEDLTFLEEFNDFQLEGRYPDYLFQINKKCTKEYTLSIFNKINDIRICLIEKLQ